MTKKLPLGKFARRAGARAKRADALARSLARMSKAAERAKAKASSELRNPPCAECGTPALMSSGQTVWPNRPDLANKKLWKCPRCPDSHVGCSERGSGEGALGFPAGAYLRGARSKLHNDVLEPLWANAAAGADYDPEDDRARFSIRSKAKSRVFAYLAQQLGIDPADCHVSRFDLDRCRLAWRALAPVDYPFIRRWAKERGE